MNFNSVIFFLAESLELKLSSELVNDFIKTRNDCISGILERASFGKFVESFVQAIQFLDKGEYEKKPDIDKYLNSLESRKSKIGDDLRICGNRIAKACYSLRNKRNIVHKGELKTNIYDLKFAFSCCQWLLSELIRNTSKSNMSMEEASCFIEYIQRPINELVEDHGEYKLVYGNLTVKNELLVLLNAHYPEEVGIEKIKKSLERRPIPSINKAIRELWEKKYIIKNNNSYKLTLIGRHEAINVVKKEIAKL